MTTTSTFVYVANRESREIMVFRLDAGSGNLTQIQNAAVNGAIMPMAVSPDRRFLYAALRNEPYAVASFSIDPSSGRLNHLADTPAPDSMPYISTDRSGRFLLGVSNPKSRIKPRKSFLCLFPIDARGIVQAPKQILPAREKSHAVLAAPSNRQVIATSCDGDVLLRWDFDAANGTLSTAGTNAAEMEAVGGPRHFVFHPNQQFLYVVNEYDGTIYTYVHDTATGALNRIQTSPIVARDPSGKSARGADLHFTPDGGLLYVSERYSDTLAAFRVDAASGMLTHLGNFATEKEPRGFNIDPLGRYLFAVGRASNSMTTYAIDHASGTLTALRRHPMSGDPNWIEIVTLAG